MSTYGKFAKAHEQLLTRLHQLRAETDLTWHRLESTERESVGYMLTCLDDALSRMMKKGSFQQAREEARRISPEIPFP